VADLRVFLDANILFTAAYSPDGLSALLVELGAAGRVTLLTSPLAIVEAERNLEAKAVAIVAHATHFVTGDVADFGRWMDRRARLPLRVMTPRQFLTEVHP
jgi:predicted nucleic acid-binding protein